MKYLTEFIKYYGQAGPDQVKAKLTKPFLVQREKFQEHSAPVKATLAVDVDRLSEILKATGKNQLKRLYYLGKDDMKVGRAEAYINLAHVSVSKDHAEIKQQGEDFLITDLGSTNGTFVNGTQLEPNQTVKMTDGDKVSFGSLGFNFYYAQTFFNLVESILARQK